MQTFFSRFGHSLVPVLAEIQAKDDGVQPGMQALASLSNFQSQLPFLQPLKILSLALILFYKEILGTCPLLALNLTLQRLFTAESSDPACGGGH